MSTAQQRAQRYRAKAEECLRLSELAQTDDTRAQYRHLAECYASLAVAEDQLAANHARFDHKRQLDRMPNDDLRTVIADLDATRDTVRADMEHLRKMWHRLAETYAVIENANLAFGQSVELLDRGTNLHPRSLSSDGVGTELSGGGAGADSAVERGGLPLGGEPGDP